MLVVFFWGGGGEGRFPHIFHPGFTTYQLPVTILINPAGTFSLFLSRSSLYLWAKQILLNQKIHDRLLPISAEAN